MITDTNTRMCPGDSQHAGACERAAGWATLHPGRGSCVHHETIPQPGLGLHYSPAIQRPALAGALLAFLDENPDGVATLDALSFLRSLPGADGSAVSGVWAAAKDNTLPGIVCRTARADQRTGGLWWLFTSAHAANAPTGGGESLQTAMAEAFARARGRS